MGLFLTVQGVSFSPQQLISITLAVIKMLMLVEGDYFFVVV